ncbi:MAG: hypothetical protein AAF442_05630 [Pseudomonadota bacterium]
MVALLWTSQEFRKKIAPFEGEKGVGVPRSALTDRLDDYHRDLKKGDWGRVIPAVTFVQREVTKYKNSVKKTVDEVRKDKTDKPRNKAVDQWEKAVGEFEKAIAACKKDCDAMNKIMLELDQRIIDAEDWLVSFKETGAENLSHRDISGFVRNSLAPISTLLARLSKLDKAWDRKIKIVNGISSIARKELSPSQIAQAIKAIEVGLNQLQK